MTLHRWAVLGAAVISMTATAQESSSGLAESERSGVIELKGGGYKPAFGSSTGYQQLMGQGGPTLFELELDRQFFQAFGSFGLGVSVGYGEKYASALVLDASNQVTGPSGSEKTSLHVLPLKAMAVYRLDYASIHWNIPLVPYVKGGLSAQHWWITKGPKLEQLNGVQARGMKYGYGFVGGLSLVLDFFEQRLAKDFDADLGVNNCMLFVEYATWRMNGFGQRGLDFSSRMLSFGLALEY